MTTQTSPTASTENQFSTTTLPSFTKISLSGVDAEKFLQGQLTCDVRKLQLALGYQATAISNLKGRVDFGVWVKRVDETTFELVVSADCASALQAHLKKYGAFSKFSTSDVEPVFACVLENEPTFSQDETLHQPQAWARLSIQVGNVWITAATQGLFQPQELRLHQRGGVDYDKGCYLGQEVIARIYFKSAPKAFLHRISGVGDVPKAGESLGKIQVVNAIAMDSNKIGDASSSQAFEALVVARPEDLVESGLTILPLPPQLQQEIGRDKN